MKTRQPFIIFSAFREDAGPANLVSHDVVKTELDRESVPFEEVRGRYDGVAERGFLVADTPENREFVARVVDAYHQESILVVSGSRDACLEHTDGRITPLGRWRRWNAVESDESDNYTIDSRGRMWVAS
jgi:hypothetical protein